MDCEIYVGKCSRKAAAILSAMRQSAKGAGVRIVETQTYKGSCELYMTWGLGHPQRRAWADAHIAKGGHVIGWDLGYFDRLTRCRVTINHDHPYRLVRDMPHTRMPKVTLREDADTSGPVIVVGMGPKSITAYGNWEAHAVKRARMAYPDKQVVVRPKYSQTPIEAVLKGASLVVCRHSNVALDACIAGVPVVCEDGIARSLYGDDIANPLNPSKEQRAQLLANAGWWQWAPSEAKHAWAFLKDHIRSAAKIC